VRSTPGKFLLFVAVMFSVASVPLLPRADAPNEEKTLTGVWVSSVTRIDPAPGQAPTFLSLQTFSEDGNFLPSRWKAIQAITQRRRSLYRRR
jgi:hypothetical protein